ncbi:uncharacterized protein LOC124946034 [Impatiens glandulifera]|uniref:uncharacterized protein LOC124946034 n=1 Tax=Impatiens glandulifera TaxID=253017 RepID=UPI001FB142ED|nr:uncharacterized protein LOC124946034 [Impatiens glandulifera]
MSFLAGRLAGTEGAYFLQESKLAVGRLIQKNATKPPPSPSQSQSQSNNPIDGGIQADVLPEILRHSLPSKIFQPPSESSLSKASKWALHSDPNAVSSISPDVLDPLRAYVSLPQVTFGPKRWVIPNSEFGFVASTANDLRITPVNPEKLKAATLGFSQMAKGFAAATVIVFGGGTVTFGLVTSHLDIHNTDDIKTKSKSLLQPKLESMKEQLVPIKIWTEQMSKKWQLERVESVKEKKIIKELSKVLGAKN